MEQAPLGASSLQAPRVGILDACGHDHGSCVALVQRTQLAQQSLQLVGVGVVDSAQPCQTSGAEPSMTFNNNRDDIRAGISHTLPVLGTQRRASISRCPCALEWNAGAVRADNGYVQQPSATGDLDCNVQTCLFDCTVSLLLIKLWAPLLNMAGYMQILPNPACRQSWSRRSPLSSRRSLLCS